MLIYRFHHPFFHYAAKVWFMNINILPCLFIFESDTRTRSSSLLWTLYPKADSNFTVSSYVKSFGCLQKRSINFSLVPIRLMYMQT